MRRSDLDEFALGPTMAKTVGGWTWVLVLLITAGGLSACLAPEGSRPQTDGKTAAPTDGYWEQMAALLKAPEFAAGWRRTHGTIEVALSPENGASNYWALTISDRGQPTYGAAITFKKKPHLGGPAIIVDWHDPARGSYHFWTDTDAKTFHDRARQPDFSDGMALIIKAARILELERLGMLIDELLTASSPDDVRKLLEKSSLTEIASEVYQGVDDSQRPCTLRLERDAHGKIEQLIVASEGESRKIETYYLLKIPIQEESQTACQTITLSPKATKRANDGRYGWLLFARDFLLGQERREGSLVDESQGTGRDITAVQTSHQQGISMLGYARSCAQTSIRICGGQAKVSHSRIASIRMTGLFPLGMTRFSSEEKKDVTCKDLVLTRIVKRRP